MLEVIEHDPPHITAGAQASGQPIPDASVSGPRGWAQHMQTVEALGQQLARATSIEDICNRIGATIAALVPQDQCRVLLMNEDRTRLEVVYLKGNDREEYRGVTRENAAVEVGQGIAGWVAESRRSQFIVDGQGCLRRAGQAGESEAFLE